MKLIDGLWYITAMSVLTLGDARGTGTAMEIGINTDPDLTSAGRDTLVFLRPTMVGPEPAFDGQGWAFQGYVAETRETLDRIPLDSLDRAKTQFVEGIAFGGVGTGKIRPAHEQTGDRAPGAEPWLVIAMPGQRHVEPVMRVMARSEREAAERAFLTPTGHGHYAGKTAGGASYVCDIRRLANCASI